MKRPCGLMDKASDFGSEDCRFESCQGRNFFSLFLLNFFTKLSKACNKKEKRHHFSKGNNLHNSIHRKIWGSHFWCFCVVRARAGAVSNWRRSQPKQVQPALVFTCMKSILGLIQLIFVLLSFHNPKGKFWSCQTKDISSNFPREMYIKCKQGVKWKDTTKYLCRNCKKLTFLVHFMSTLISF